MAREDNDLSALFKSKKDSEHKEGTLNSNSENETGSDVIRDGNTTLNDVREVSMNRYLERVNKPKVSDTHERYTFLLRNDLRRRLDKLAKNKVRGFKTQLENDAIEAMLDAYEQNK